MNDPLWGISGIALWVFGIGYVSLKYLGVGYRENSDNPNSDPGGLDYFIQGVSDALNLQLYSDEQVRTIFEQKDLRSIVPPSVVPPLGSVDPNLTGTNGSDTLTGGPEANIMAGGAGRDTLWGGANADTFVFTKGTSGIKATTADTIMDWEVIDQIDMTIRGNKKNYEEDDTTAASISKAAAYAEKTFTDKNTTHVFLYNKKKDTGYLLSDLDNNDKYETGVILKGAGASSSFSHTDII
jgi:Ca2+-binding RTX toxin-like protein